MNDVHIRAILLIVIGLIGIASALGYRYLAGDTLTALGLVFLGIAALMAAIYWLLFAQEVSGSSEDGE